MIRQIAKKNNIVLPGAPVRVPPARVGAPMRNVQPVGAQAGIPQVRISAPADRACGTSAKDEDRYMREELVALARAQGVDTKQNMDLLCKALGISPRAIGGVLVEKKGCGTKERGDDRYTREDVVTLARARNIPVQGRSMDELCVDLGLTQVAVPISSSAAGFRPLPLSGAVSSSAAARNAAVARLSSAVQPRQQREIRSSLSENPMPEYTPGEQMAIDDFLSSRL
jgi:hypothetical protein